MDQSEAEGHHPAAFAEERLQVVRRGEDHAQGDGGFHQSRWQTHHVERRQAERDRVRQSEGRHHLQHVHRGRLEGIGGAPALDSQHHHGRQQEGYEKENVVVALPDVEHAFEEELVEAGQAGRLCQIDSDEWRRLAEDGGGGVGADREVQQSAMKRVFFPEEPVCQLQLNGGRENLPVQLQCGVVAVEMLADFEPAPTKRDGLAVGLDPDA